MSDFYRISNWSEYFENNRTRELKRMAWVPIPNRMDGSGYTMLVDHPNGAAHLGAWVAMLEIASRQTIRGTFPQEGAGLPQALARISRLPAVVFEEVIPRLLNIGWLQAFTQIPQEGAGIPQEGAAMSHPTDEEGRKEWKEGRKEAAVDSLRLSEGAGNGKPTWEMALNWMRNAQSNGADYTEAETRTAYAALGANGWMWGRNPVADFRLALERQIQTDRGRTHKKKRSAPNL